MKTKILKKLLAGVTTLAMAAQFAVALPASASTNLYTQDFEGIQLTNLTYTLGNNTEARIQSNVAGNTTSFYNYYVDGGSGDRESTLKLPETYGANVPVKFSMLMRIMGSNTNGSVFEVRDSSGIAVFNMSTSGSYLAGPTINGDSVTLTTTKPGASVMGVSNYDTSGWLRFDAVIDFRTSPSSVNLTVTDITNSNKVIYSGKTVTTAKNINTIYGKIGRANGAFAFDDIVIDQLDESEAPNVTTYTIKYIVNGVESSEVVDENGYPEKIPETDKTGYIFKGWQVGDDTSNLISTDTLAATAVTADVTYTAIYEKDPDYIEPMTSVTFGTLPSGGLLVSGANQGETASNSIGVKVTGELGTDLLANPDSRVTDLDVQYELKGFRWVASKNEASTDPEGSTTYCDGYGSLIVNASDHTADFQITNHPFNYYGQVTATVTYNGKQMTATSPLAYIGNPAKSSANDILPRGGYVSDFNSYSPDMVGYETTISPDNRGAVDVVTDNWAAYGGNSGRKLSIAEDDGGKFLKLKATGTNSSCFAANQITAVTDNQVVFSQMVRFYTNNSTILLKSTNPVTWTAGVAISFTVTFTGTEININGSKIADATKGIWYNIVITSDVTSKKCMAVVYDADGSMLGSSETVDFNEAGSLTPSFYMFRTPDAATGELDFNNVTIKRAEIDEQSFSTTDTSAGTIAIPEAGSEDATAEITVSALTTDGLPAIGKAEWTIADETISGVTITPVGDDAHTATVTVTEGATPGDMPINVSIGGKTTTMNILLTSSQDSVKFIKAPTSISIPLEEGASETYQYEAIVADGNGNAIEGKTVTYSLYDSKNANPITAPQGTTFENGVLTVTSSAKAATVYVRATSTNSNDETITKAVKVVIHGLAFDFGAGTDDDIADGYTSIAPSTAYSASLGYGIEGTATAGGEASLTDADTDYLEGSFIFKANVENNKLYKVVLNYAGTAVFENISTDLSGVVRTNDSISSAEYQTFVSDGILDITFDNRVASVVIEKIDDKTPGAKPNIYTVGDSTIANNGSWAYVLYRDQENYTELTNLATFSNNGRGGKNLVTYYTGGEFWDRVITNVRPGDYVMIGDMGTNGMGSSYEADFNYYIDACLAMGAKVILNSYSPHMAVGDYAGCYDSSTHTFNGWRQDAYDVIVRRIYEERKAELVGFVEIGKNADVAFSAYVADYAANGYESADAAAAAIIACAGDKGKDPDHNHYGNGTIACQLMLNGYGETKGIVAQLVDLLSSGVTTSYTGTAATAQFRNLDGTKAVIYVAEYNSDNTLKSVNKKDITVLGDNFTETVDYTAVNASNVKVYVWTDTQEKIPEL